jgi:hypothetical protein
MARIPDLIPAILDFIAKWNAEPTPFVWTVKQRTSWLRSKGAVSGWKKSPQDAQNRKKA